MPTSCAPFSLLHHSLLAPLLAACSLLCVLSVQGTAEQQHGDDGGRQRSANDVVGEAWQFLLKVFDTIH